MAIPPGRPCPAPSERESQAARAGLRAGRGRTIPGPLRRGGTWPSGSPAGDVGWGGWKQQARATDGEVSGWVMCGFQPRIGCVEFRPFVFLNDESSLDRDIPSQSSPSRFKLQELGPMSMCKGGRIHQEHAWRSGLIGGGAWAAGVRHGQQRCVACVDGPLRRDGLLAGTVRCGVW